METIKRVYFNGKDIIVGISVTDVQMRPKSLPRESLIGESREREKRNRIFASAYSLYFLVTPMLFRCGWLARGIG